MHKKAIGSNESRSGSTAAVLKIMENMWEGARKKQEYLKEIDEHEV